MEHSYASTQVNLPAHLSKRIADFAKTIPVTEHSTDGLESEHHVTVKYGLEHDSAKSATDALKGEWPARIRLGRLSTFENSTGDVLKLSVVSPDLHRMHRKLNALPHGDSHPVYQPHVTVAYLQPGLGQKYVGKSISGVSGKEFTGRSIQHSDADEKLTQIDLSRRDSRN